MGKVRPVILIMGILAISGMTWFAVSQWNEMDRQDKAFSAEDARIALLRDTAPSSQVTPKTPPTKRVGTIYLPSTPARAKPAQPNQLEVRLPRLWTLSKKQVSRDLRKYELVEHDDIPQDYPDALVAGGEFRVYNVGGGTEIIAAFNAKGYVTSVSMENQEVDRGGLRFTLDQWREAFGRFGLPDCGEPAKTAPEAYYWGPPHNKTGGYEIRLTADEKRRVWQVQVESPEDFFPN